MLVIHFAFGSPFGVYQIARGGSLRSARSAAAVGAYFLLWPIFAAAFISKWLSQNEFQRLSPTQKNPNITPEELVASIQTQLEAKLFTDGSTSSIFEFREIVSRFSGLSLVLFNGEPANWPKELLSITGHKNISAASACVERRNQHRIFLHQCRARKEFVDLIFQLCAARPQDEPGIALLALQIANAIDDKKAAAQITPLTVKRFEYREIVVRAHSSMRPN